MKSRSTFFLTAFLIAALASLVSACHATDREQQLKGTWKGKYLTLRVPDSAKTIKFDSEGNRIGDPKPGLWIEDSRFYVTSVKVQDGVLTLEGYRTFYDFDPSRGKFDKVDTDRRVTVTMALPASADAQCVLATFSKAFLTEHENIADTAPSYWQTCLRGKIEHRAGRSVCSEEKRPEETAAAGQLYKVGKGVSAPSIIFSPDPEYPMSASRTRRGGSVVLRIVITPEGVPEQIRIVQPRGMGLDERAVAAVSQWKFRPAKKDGRPVPVLVDVEMNFDLR